jgi:hypothetical protein
MKGKGQAGSAATRKVGFPWWIQNDGGLKFQISYDFGACDVMLHQKKFIEITMMITRCCPIGNDKRPLMATAPIEILYLIV